MMGQNEAESRSRACGYGVVSDGAQPGGNIGKGPFFDVGFVNFNWPLSKWSTVKAFDTADDCQSVLGNWQGAAVYPNGTIDVYIPNPNHEPPSRSPQKQDAAGGVSGRFKS
jgi:hypothetical protein